MEGSHAAEIPPILVRPITFTAKRGPSLPSGRIDLTAIAVGRFDHRVCNVADRLKKNPGTVSRWFTKADRRSQYDPEYLPHLDDLDAEITHQTEPKVIK
jgi:hypothetical protein